MRLIISTCTEKFHEPEFVRLIEDILKKNNVKFFTRHYAELAKRDLSKAQKIIICSTALQDNALLPNLSKFEWIRRFPSHS